METLQRVIESAPVYAQAVTGLPPGATDARSLYTILPEGKSYDDKFVYGIELDGEMVGCADLVRGYPVPATAYLGLLLLVEPFQRRGWGSEAYRLLEELVASWSTCDRIRLAVVPAAEGVIPFWEKLGFAPTGERTPYRYGSIASESILFEKPLRPGPR
jgi:RimJ/RimL family protein N-acetyltransferase